MARTPRTVGRITGALLTGTVLAGLAFTSPAATAQTTAAPAATAEAEPRGLATCVAHRQNTVGWADCKGGTEKSVVRLAARCSTGWKYSDWKTVNPGQKVTVRYECWHKIHDAKAQIRKY